MFKDESLNLCGVWRGLAGVINLCPNCYQRVGATARGSMQIQQKRQKALWLGARHHLFPCWCFPDTNEWEALHFSAKRKDPDIFVGGRERELSGRVNFKPPLSIVGSVFACFGNIPCKLCKQGFTVHVHTMHVHTNAKCYLFPGPAQGIYIKIKLYEKWNYKTNVTRNVFIPCVLTHRVRFVDDESEHLATWCILSAMQGCLLLPNEVSCKSDVSF